MTTLTPEIERVDPETGALTPVTDKWALQKEIIRKKGHHFGLGALIAQLERMGYKVGDLLLRSTEERASRSSLIDSVEFHNEGQPKVVVNLNMGILTPNSSLPSFFWKHVDTGHIDRESFLKFLDFFGHHLNRYLLSMTYVEKNPLLLPNWKGMQVDFVKLLGVKSISTLELLFQRCFPEFHVGVRKVAKYLRRRVAATILGQTLLGHSAILGEKQAIGISNFDVVLTIDYQVTETGTPWPLEIQSRLGQLIFPLLHHSDIFLSVILIIKGEKGTLILNTSSLLGYARLGATDSPQRILIHRGFIRDDVFA